MSPAPKWTSEERVAALAAKLQLTLPDAALALTALRHKSYCNEHRQEGFADNERLEFLGDAVVDLVVSHLLMERFPKAAEGELSKLRALLVNEEGLARVARSLDLGELLMLGRGEQQTGGRAKTSVLADALEAVIGAVYLSRGFAVVSDFITREFGDAVAGLTDGRSGDDYKTRLQEDVQNRLKLSPRYQVISETGPEHDKRFEVEVTVGSDTFGRAQGRSKKEAEQAAAQKTLAMMAALDPKS